MKNSSESMDIFLWKISSVVLILPISYSLETLTTNINNCTPEVFVYLQYTYALTKG